MDEESEVLRAQSIVGQSVVRIAPVCLCWPLGTWRESVREVSSGSARAPDNCVEKTDGWVETARNEHCKGRQLLEQRKSEAAAQIGGADTQGIAPSLHELCSFPVEARPALERLNRFWLHGSNLGQAVTSRWASVGWERARVRNPESPTSSIERRGGTSKLRALGAPVRARVKESCKGARREATRSCFPHAERPAARSILASLALALPRSLCCVWRCSGRDEGRL